MVGSWGVAEPTRRSSPAGLDRGVSEDRELRGPPPRRPSAGGSEGLRHIGQVRPMATSQSSLASRTTEMPSSALHRSSTRWWRSWRVPSARRAAGLDDRPGHVEHGLKVDRNTDDAAHGAHAGDLDRALLGDAPLAGSHASAEAKVVRARRNSGMRVRASYGHLHWRGHALPGQPGHRAGAIVRGLVAGS